MSVHHIELEVTADLSQFRCVTELSASSMWLEQLTDPHRNSVTFKSKYQPAGVT